MQSKISEEWHLKRHFIVISVFGKWRKFWSSRWYKISLWSTEIQMHARQDIQTTLVFSFSINVFYSNQTFLRLDFFFSFGDFENAPKRAFLNVLFLRTCFTIHNYHFTYITNTLFNKQLRLGRSPQSCLYFQDFQCSKLLNGCLVPWLNKQNFKCIPVIFQRKSLTYCMPLVKDQSSFYQIRS